MSELLLLAAVCKGVQLCAFLELISAPCFTSNGMTLSASVNRKY